MADEDAQASVTFNSVLTQGPARPDCASASFADQLGSYLPSNLLI